MDDKMSKYVLESIRKRVLVDRDAIIHAHRMVQSSVWCCGEGQVAYIQDGKDYVVSGPVEIPQVPGITIKTTGIEHYSLDMMLIYEAIKYELLPVTCANVTLHVFEAKVGAVSFPYHSDPANVIMVMLSGSKEVWVDNLDSGPVMEIIPEDGALHIPYMVPHKVVNHEDSIMLSIGIEPFTTTHIEREG